MIDGFSLSYQERDSFVHSLSSLSKLVCYVLLLSAALISDSLCLAPCSFSVIISLVILSKLKLRVIFRFLYSFSLFFIFVFLLNSLFYQKENYIFHFSVFYLTHEGMYQGALIIVRIALAVSLTNILLSVSTPMEISEGISEIIYPLKFLKIPVNTISAVMSLTLTFVPVLHTECNEIIMAQKARGINVNEGHLFSRLKAIIPVAVPLFVVAFKKADELSTAMEARGYREEKETKFESLTKQDFIALSISLLILIISILFRSL